MPSIRPKAHPSGTDSTYSAQLTQALLGTCCGERSALPPRHLHDRDVEGVGDVGGAGQVPAAVETLRVVVGPTHQHWLFWRDCQGKRKEELFIQVGFITSS